MGAAPSATTIIENLLGASQKLNKVGEFIVSVGNIPGQMGNYPQAMRAITIIIAIAAVILPAVAAPILTV
jgi:hypothetical protein